VTGHRKLTNTELIRRGVDQVLGRLDAALGSHPHCFTVLSPLAEGADRLIAQQVLAWPAQAPELAPDLEAILPLPPAEYQRDFKTDSSRAEFAALLGRAVRQWVVPAAPSRTAAYMQAGRMVVQGCDVLIAVWNGRPATGEGGTAQVVDYARKIGRWLFWIHAKDGTIEEENRPGVLDGANEVMLREQQDWRV
jgi:hypothetical protein